jgi:hypothetical protein
MRNTKYFTTMQSMFACMHAVSVIKPKLDGLYPNCKFHMSNYPPPGIAIHFRKKLPLHMAEALSPFIHRIKSLFEQTKGLNRNNLGQHIRYGSQTRWPSSFEQ